MKKTFFTAFICFLFFGALSQRGPEPVSRHGKIELPEGEELIYIDLDRWFTLEIPEHKAVFTQNKLNSIDVNISIYDKKSKEYFFNAENRVFYLKSKKHNKFVKALGFLKSDKPEYDFRLITLDNSEPHRVMNTFYAKYYDNAHWMKNLLGEKENIHFFSKDRVFSLERADGSTARIYFSEMFKSGGECVTINKGHGKTWSIYEDVITIKEESHDTKNGYQVTLEIYRISKNNSPYHNFKLTHTKSRYLYKRKWTEVARNDVYNGRYR